MTVTPRTWLVTGASGLFGRAFCEAALARGDDVVGVRHIRALDVPGVREISFRLDKADDVRAFVADVRPDVIVHAAGITDVDACERDEPAAERLHVDATGVLAVAARASGARFVYISTDHLWDGTVCNVTEEEPTRPLNAYARTKLAGEAVALEAAPDGLVVRTNFFGDGPPWRPSFSDWVVSSLDRGDTIRAFADVHFTPISLGHLSEALLDLTSGEISGVLHVAGRERLSKLDFVQRLAAAVGMPGDIVAASVRDAELAAPRPRDMSLDCSLAAAHLGRPLPDVAEGFATLARVVTHAAPNSHDPNEDT